LAGHGYADEEQAYGHSKAEYFSSGVEGALILLAAASIGWTAWGRLFYPQPIEQVGLGGLVSGIDPQLRRRAYTAPGISPSLHGFSRGNWSRSNSSTAACACSPACSRQSAATPASL
jgi:hypothetical protein